MTDTTDDDKRSRPPRGRSDRPRSGDDRPRRPRPDGDKPFRTRAPGGDRPERKDRDERGPRRAGEAPRRDGDKPFRARGSGEDRPFRKSRPDGDRPFGNKPFRKPGDRPFRKADDRPRPSRAVEAERPRHDRDVAVEAAPPEPTEERIAKAIARAGLASRRDAEAMIAEGRVTLNGETLTSPAVNVTAADRITVDGEPLPARERTRLWIFHKPRGLVTTARDPEGRPTVFESLPEDMPRVVAIGRLDINTEGLLLLTNDGGLAKVIAHPDTGWLRRYKVRAHGDVTQDRLDALRDGVTLDGMEYGPIEARLDRVQGDNVWLTLGLREGKNREVKRILEHLGLQVNRLIRLSFGPFQLGDLESGLVEEVKTKVLKEQLGDALAAEAGVDFESPVREPIAAFGSPKPRREEGDRDTAERPRRSAGGRFGQDRDGERPSRGRAGRDRFDEGRGGRRDERPSRSRSEETRPRPVHGTERRPSIWRADESEGDRPRSKAPRRGQDPKAARAAAAERPRERVGAIQAGEGRKVTVERLVGEPGAERERPAPKPRRPAFGKDRPPRRDDRDGTERPARRFGADREGSDRKGPRAGGPGRGERPFRGKRPPEAGGGPRGSAPKGGPRGRRPS